MADELPVRLSLAEPPGQVLDCAKRIVACPTGSRAERQIGSDRGRGVRIRGGIDSGPAAQHVIANAAVQQVVSGPAVQRINTSAAKQTADRNGSSQIRGHYDD